MKKFIEQKNNCDKMYELTAAEQKIMDGVKKMPYMKKSNRLF
jgi:hypothetical protein